MGLALPSGVIFLGYFVLLVDCVFCLMSRRMASILPEAAWRICAVKYIFEMQAQKNTMTQLPDEMDLYKYMRKKRRTPLNTYSK